MTKNIPSNFFATAVAVVAIAVIVIGLSIIGSPHTARLHRLDEERISDLRNIRRAITTYYGQHNQLPAMLGELKWIQNLKDAETGEPYSYTLLSATSYQLCAVFDLDGSEKNKAINNRQYDDEGNFPNYVQGRNCYTFTVPVKNKIK